MKLTPDQFEELDEDARADYSPIYALDDAEKVEAYVPSWAAEFDSERREKAKSTLDKVRGELKDAKSQTVDPEADQLRGEVLEFRKKDAVTEAIEATGGIPELLRPHLMLSAGLDEDGNVVATRDGKPILTEDGDAMTLTQVAEQMKADGRFGTMFRAPAKTTGAPPPRTPARKTKPKKLADMSREEKAAFLNECYDKGMNDTEARHALLKLR